MGGIKELGAIIAPFPIFTPSPITLLDPINTLSSIIHEETTHPGWIIQLFPILIEAGTSLGTVYQVLNVHPSPIVT